VLQCALERDPASQHLRGIVEEMLFVSQAKLHDENGCG
jgi:hypothetical protein